MPSKGAFEVRHEGRIYRAPDMDTVLSWARDRRIALEDEIRPAGTTVWKSVRESEELQRLLDPAHWWKINMAEKTFKAPDFETVVKWSKEGRVTSDAVIEGPRTPPGGIRADALPRLAGHLRTPGQDEGEDPPRIRFDGKEYCPGDLETLRDWIAESRVPPEADISLAGRPWEPLVESGLYEPELWPAGAWTEEDEDVPAEASGTDAGAEAADSLDEGSAQEVSDDGKPAERKAGAPSPFDGSSPIVVRTLTEEISISDPQKLAGLYRKRRVHSYDTVTHPALPDGECTVAVAMEALGIRATRMRWWLWAILAVIGLGGAGILVFDPFSIF